MQPIEIIILVFSIVFVLSVFGNLIYKKAKGKPIGECADCKKKMNKFVKEYRKKYH